MSLDFKQPFSAFSDGDKNPASFIVGQHYEARDLAIRKLIELYHDGVDVNDPEIFTATLARYGLLGDGFDSTSREIVNEVNRRLRNR